MRTRALAWLVVGLSLVGWACAADPVASPGPNAVDPSDYQALHWRLIGPFRGGRVLAVAGVPGDSRHFYFGAVDGGVWATQDAGRTWQPIFDHEPVGSIGAIAVAPSNPSTIYVGTGEADMRSDIAQGDGMYKSTDGGANWTHIGLTDSRQISRILVDPHDPDLVYVAVLGHPYGPSAERGVFRSRDGGQHWRKVLYENPNVGAADLAFKPGDANTIYAALWQTRRPPWNVYPPSNGPGSGLYVSHDGGDHWHRIVGHGFIAHPGRIGLAVSPAQPDRVYALADGPWGQAGLYRSDDDGADWQHVTSDPRIWGRGWYFCSLTADPTNADHLYVMNTIVLESKDGGAHFIAYKGDPTGDDYHALWIDPTDTQRQILGSDQGTQVTLDGGKTWSSWYNQPTAQIYHVSTDNRFPYWVYGSQQDSGAVALPSRGSSNDGITMEQFHEITPGGENGMIAPDPENPHIVYGDGSDAGASVDKLDWTTQQVRQVDPTLAYPLDHYRSTWTMPLTFSKIDKKTLYFANQRLFATSDGGEHWSPISPDLTRRDPGTPPNLDPTTARDDFHVGKRRGVIYAIAPSPLDDGVIWVGTDDGLVWRTADDGARWRNVTPRALTPWSKVGGIELSHFQPGVAYLAIDRHRLNDDTPYIYVTRDDGRSWRRIDSGIPRGSFVNVVREDPVRPGLLYAGTEFGIYVSFDGGAHWQSLQQNLPVTSVRDIDVHGDDLVIATHGRGFWIMDDVTALRQMDQVKPGTVTLFAPAPAIRVRTASFTGTPMPKDEPMAANPPDGAIIDYVLPNAVQGPVVVTILDASGQVVHRYTSAQHVPPLNPAKLRFAPKWVPPIPVPAATPGMQRFVWDLHYAAPGAPAAGGPFGNSGVWAPPGQYTVELTVDGRDYRQALRVKPDPRVKVSDAALQREFELARKVEAARTQAFAALDRAGKLLDALNARLATAGRAHREMAALLAKASNISGTHPNADRAQELAEKPPQRTDSLRALAMDLFTLQSAVDGADADPSPDDLTSYATLSRMVTATLAEWSNLEQVDVPKLNARLSALGQKPI
ncbi:MAG: WD40/YVTN/BNR-like repeat-containing protein [Steroidobacteraceae bacterium]